MTEENKIKTLVHFLNLLMIERGSGGLHGILDKMTSANFTHHKNNAQYRIDSLCDSIREQCKEYLGIELFNPDTDNFKESDELTREGKHFWELE